MLATGVIKLTQRAVEAPAPTNLAGRCYRVVEDSALDVPCEILINAKNAQKTAHPKSGERFHKQSYFSLLVGTNKMDTTELTSRNIG